jgi:hypothetical protein
MNTSRRTFLQAAAALATLGAMMGAPALPPATAPLSSGSIIKGVLASLACQSVAFWAPVPLLRDNRTGDAAHDSALDRRQGIGVMLMAGWGLTHWIMVLPLLYRWKRRGEARTVTGLQMTSCLAFIPIACYAAVLLFGMARDAGQAKN